MIRYINKDITTVEKGMILHGVNCQRAMGSGIAKALYTKWPKVREEYLTIPKNSPCTNHLGDIQEVLVAPDVYVYNLFTQEFYGRDGSVYASVDAIMECLYTLAFYIEDEDVYMPKIGCGLGGLDWEADVEPVVKEWAELYKYNVFVCEL